MPNEQRSYSIVDRFCFIFDDALRALQDNPRITARDYPAENLDQVILTESERKHSAACMRINHAGEVSAQGLYHGQSLACHSPVLRAEFSTAAIEEGDHLAWCSQRLTELNSHKSWLTPFWYFGSFALGLSAGMVGDRWSLGFLAETETQVMRHLDQHLTEISPKDHSSILILKQMKIDEEQHRDHAINQGAAVLPNSIKRLMQLMSKVMVKTAYRF